MIILSFYVAAKQKTEVHDMGEGGLAVQKSAFLYQTACIFWI